MCRLDNSPSSHFGHVSHHSSGNDCWHGYTWTPLFRHLHSGFNSGKTRWKRSDAYLSCRKQIACDITHIQLKNTWNLLYWLYSWQTRANRILDLVHLHNHGGYLQKIKREKNALVFFLEPISGWVLINFRRKGGGDGGAITHDFLAEHNCHGVKNELVVKLM